MNKDDAEKKLKEYLESKNIKITGEAEMFGPYGSGDNVLFSARITREGDNAVRMYYIDKSGVTPFGNG